MAKLIIKNNYATIPNTVLKDKRLSLRAKGLFALIQSKPNGWDFSKDRLLEESKEGITAFSTAFRELKKLQYLTTIPLQSPNGKFGGHDYILNDCPEIQQKPRGGKTTTRLIDHSEKQGLSSKKDLSKKDLSKKENTLQSGDCGENFSSDEYITNLISTGTYPIKIIGWYFKVKGLNFPTKVAGDTELKRWLRDANILKDYPQQKIGEVYKLVSEKFPFDWKLSTIVKYVNETKSDEQILIECIEEAKSALGLDGDWEARARRSYLRIKEIPFENHWANPVWTKWLKKYPYLKT